MGRTLKELAELIGGELVGDPAMVIERPVPAGTNDPAGITFAGSPAYLEKALASEIGAIIVDRSCNGQAKNIIKTANPRAAFGVMLSIFDRPITVADGIHPSAVIEPGAQIDPSARIGAQCVISSTAIIGVGARIHPLCFVGPRCEVGEGSEIHPNCTLLRDVEIGKNCLIQAGCTLGSDGFGFIWDGSKQQKIPQAGRVVLEDFVEIGAGSCIDRATCGETRIKSGAKLDNLVQVAHNTAIGRHSVLAAQAGIAGSAILGDRCVVGGQVGIGDHVTVADEVHLGGRAGVTVDLAGPAAYYGLPARPLREALRSMAATNKLPDLMKKVKELEKKLQELEAKHED